MTFEDFQATRQHSADLGSVIADARWLNEPVPASGYVYLGALFIEDVKDHWPAASKALGKYHLIIGNQEWVTDDLESLERGLYAFAVSEGYTLPTTGETP